MANIMKVKISESERGKLLSIWLEDGVDYTPINAIDDVEEIIDRWAAGELSDDEFIAELEDSTTPNVKYIADTVNTKLERINRNLTTDGIHVYYDGDEFEKVQLDRELEKHLIKLLKERDTEEGKKDFQSWANFAVNLYGNVKDYIREQLVSWMKAQDWLSFTEDGCFIGYRGGQKNELTGIAESKHQGRAIVNGRVVSGHIPNPDGGIVEMPRSEVVDDSELGCAAGLHVGTFDYARQWGDDVIMRVKVDPRDVVSVPLYSNDAKIRCCRFEVLDHLDYCTPDFEKKLAIWGQEWTYEEDPADEEIEWDEPDCDYDELDEHAEVAVEQAFDWDGAAASENNDHGQTTYRFA